ncbi:hypothetical protein F8M41_015752 [Gigaspora margarita]|uniref:Uncharacterized protein n=1 Tax=Gigaspora margarita TaxID=4874 RepID=A0A8H4AQC8_GIGMA|nr:hypothetical protein F8M41_015752 [Gigaspora margarita]
MVSLQNTLSTAPILFNIILRLLLYKKTLNNVPILSKHHNTTALSQEILNTILFLSKHTTALSQETVPILSRQHTTTASSQETVLIHSRQHTSEFSRTSFEADSTSVLLDQLNFEVDHNYFLQTYEFESNADLLFDSFNLYEEQSLSWTNIFLTTTNRPTTSSFSPLNIFCQGATVFEITTFVADPEILSIANIMYQSKK